MLTAVNFAGVNRGLSTPATAIQPAAGEAEDFDDCPELFQVRGHLYNLVTLRLIEPEDHRFFPRLQNAIARAPDFVRHAPVVLDAAAVAGRPPPNMAEFARRLRQQRLVPVGRNGRPTPPSRSKGNRSTGTNYTTLACLWQPPFMPKGWPKATGWP
jgi:hypothetical protein